MTKADRKRIKRQRNGGPIFLKGEECVGVPWAAWCRFGGPKLLRPSYWSTPILEPAR